MPRKVSVSVLGISLLLMLLLHAIIFRQRGGAIQKIVTSKTITTDIRSATIIDFIYALVLLVFKEYSNVPMSTTWVFIGLLAGREIAIALHLKSRSLVDTGRIIAKDGAKLAARLGVSIGLAFGLPILDAHLSGPDDDRNDRAASVAGEHTPTPVGPSAETTASPDGEETGEGVAPGGDFDEKPAGEHADRETK